MPIAIAMTAKISTAATITHNGTFFNNKIVFLIFIISPYIEKIHYIILGHP
ncbi:MAG TPA: hypothetical protein PLA73_10120 [Sedimentibacter sp.]|nr:hypothetical protein [Sedimentibacter sp.]